MLFNVPSNVGSNQGSASLLRFKGVDLFVQGANFNALRIVKDNTQILRDLANLQVRMGGSRVQGLGMS